MFGYVKFSPLPVALNSMNVLIESANVKLTFKPGQTSSYNAKLLAVKAADWSETGLTWNNQPYGTSGSSSGHNNCTYYEFNVRQIVSD